MTTTKAIHADSDRPTRAEAAVALRVSGATYAQIAKTLEYTGEVQARTAVEVALAATVTDEDRVEQRAIAGRRIERLLLSVWGKATNEKADEHLSAVRTALALADRHIRLYGLDAPAQMVVYTPAGEEIAAWVAAMAAQTRGELPMDADIVLSEVADG